MSTLLISEQDKLNILKQYGLLAEQDGFRFNKPGDKNYTPPTGPYAPPGEIEIPSSEEFYDMNNGAWGLSISDWISFVSGFFGLPGNIVSFILDLLTAKYYHDKGDKYEMGLRLMFAVIPFDQLIRSTPVVKKYTKKQLFDLLLSIKTSSSSTVGKIKTKIKKEEISDILMLINNLKLNPKTITSYIYKFYLRIKIKSVVSRMTLKEFLYFVSKNVVRDKTPRNKKIWKIITNLIIKQLAKMGIIFVSWDYLFNAMASPEDKNYYKLKQNLNKTLESFEDETIDDYVSLISDLEGIGNLLKNKK